MYVIKYIDINTNFVNERARERELERERNDVCLKQSGREKCCKFHFELNPHAAN